MKSKIIAEWLFWIVLSVLIFSTGMMVSVAAPVLVLLAPVPFMILTCRQGPREASLGVVFGGVLVFMALGTVPSVMYLIMVGVLGVFFGVAAIRAKNGVDFVFMALTGSIMSKVALLVVFTRFAGVNPFMVTPEAAQGMVAAVAGVMSQSGIGASQETIRAYAEQMIATVSLLMPAMLILFAAADTMVSYTAGRKIFSRLGDKKFPELPPFGTWRFPKDIFWALLAALIVDLAGKAMPDVGIFKLLSANLMEVLRAVFLVEGLALCWHFMTTKGLHRALKVFLTAFCVFFSPVSYILSVVGIFDIWYDLRSRLRRK